jgi:gliding motility-associated-like protein
VTTEPATGITTTAATLNGTVNARNFQTTAVSIRYSLVKADVDGGGGTTVVVSPTSVSGNVSTTISGNVSGLTPSTTYYFRASATNAGGTASGATLSFTTAAPPVAPVVTTEPATDITTTTATLNGTVNARNFTTTALSIRYSTVKADVDGGGGTSVVVAPTSVSGNVSTTISGNVSGLTPSTTYYFIASATNAGGTANGATLSFTTATPIPAPSVITLPATQIALTTATINGSVNANGSQTSQITLKYSTIRSEVDAGNGLTPLVIPSYISGNATTPISAKLSGLLPNTTYFYRAAATTPGGFRTGVTLSFTTLSKTEILVPSAFSPNGDGQNDMLIPFTFGIRSLSLFKVMNRWGQIVFETKELGRGWDGNYRGSPQPPESYTWVVEGIDVTGKTIRKSGGSLLVR